MKSQSSSTVRIYVYQANNLAISLTMLTEAMLIEDEAVIVCFLYLSELLHIALRLST